MEDSYTSIKKKFDDLTLGKSDFDDNLTLLSGKKFKAALD